MNTEKYKKILELIDDELDKRNEKNINIDFDINFLDNVFSDERLNKDNSILLLALVEYMNKNNNFEFKNYLDKIPKDNIDITILYRLNDDDLFKKFENYLK